MVKSVTIKKKVPSKARLFSKKLTPALLILLLPIVALTAFFYLYVLKDLPSPTKLSSPTLPQSSQIFDRNGELLYTIYGDKNQTFIPLSEIPKDVQEATIAIEDRSFYQHGPVDFRGIARAFVSTVFYRELQGGSTLTQQLVKNTLLTPDRTIQRKVKEVILSFATELIYPKDKILEMYLNQVPYGGTAWGIESAARTYFGKNAKDLTLAEAALLAGLPEAPTTYSPFGSRPELAERRQREVLRAMRDEGYITSEEEEEALRQRIVYKRVDNEIKAPHFVLYVKDLLTQKYGERRVAEGGLRVITSLDLEIQEFAEDTVASEVAELAGLRVGNGAALITKPGTGEVLAMVGSKNYFNNEEDGNVNVTLALRQPGSSIKPINYALGLMNGYTAATTFVDNRTCFPNPPQRPYCPVNYDGRYRGPVTMRQALASSLNVPAVKMLKLNGVEPFIELAREMGITTFQDPSRYGLSLTLGGGEVRMTDMAVAFGVFANQGYRIDLHPILKVTDSSGKVLEEYKPPETPAFSGKRVLPSSIAFIISHILQDNNARANAFGSNSLLRIGNQPVSVKTGTTDDLRDNWAIGYTQEYLVAAWVGNNDNTPMSRVASGVTGASPIWNVLMTNLIEGKPQQLPEPDTVVQRTTCIQQASAPDNDDDDDGDDNEQNQGGCARSVFEYFVRGTEGPRRGETLSRGRTVTEKAWVKKDTGALAAEGDTENVEEREVTFFIDATGDKYCISCPSPTPTSAPTPTPQP